MKFLIDIIPIALFFVAYKFYGIYTATLVAMVASVIQTFWHRYSTGKFEKMHVITLLIIVLLGGMTLFFQNEMFIKWKPTIVNFAFALAILIGTIVMKEPAIKGILGNKMTLPNFVWYKLNWAWSVFFVCSGVLNLYVAYQYSTDTWVNFKLFGLMGLTFLFIIAQTIYISKHLPKE